MSEDVFSGEPNEIVDICKWCGNTIWSNYVNSHSLCEDAYERGAEIRTLEIKDLIREKFIPTFVGPSWKPGGEPIPYSKVIDAIEARWTVQR
jgi:hypothetical protein